MLERAHADFVEHFDTPERVSYDFAYHRALAEASHNPVIKAMLMIVIPDILAIYQRDRICVPNSQIIEEHEGMLNCIKAGDPDGAGELMNKHLQGVLKFAKQRLEQGN